MSDLASNVKEFAVCEGGGPARHVGSFTEAKVMVRKQGTTSGKAHAFGGDWTTLKLDILAKYLSAYTRALKSQPFVKAYIDAFAGTGYRTMSKAGGESADDRSEPANLAFPDLAEPEPQQLLAGSARLALEVEPAFDRYIFIEQNRRHVRALESLKEELPDKGSKITITRGEANAEIQRLCRPKWGNRRAVLFLDPYGMQVEWATIEAIARTKSIDLWLLFPLGIGVNRLVTRSGEIPAEWQRRLDLLLGPNGWRDAFYTVVQEPQLFDEPQERVVKASVATLGRYFNERLAGLFPGVVKRPAVLRNSVGNPLFLLCFAAANENGAKTAVKIAEDLLEGLG